MVEDETKAENSNDVQERLTEDSGHRSTESINSVKPDEICSKVEAAKEEHVVENDIRAENSNDVQ